MPPLSNRWTNTLARLPILGAAITILLAGCGPGGEPQKAGAPAGGPPGGMKLPVEAGTVEQLDWPITARAVGSLAADEQVTIRNLVAGYIKDIPAKEGSLVKSGDPVVLIDDEKLRYELQRAAARHEAADSLLRRRQPLFNQKLITEAEIVDAQSGASASEADWALAKRILADAAVRAPMDGTLGRRYVSPGDFVPVGARLFDLVKTDVLKLDFSVPEVLLSRVSTGTTIRVTTAAYADRAFTGTVDFIDPVIDEATRSVRLRARVGNADGLLRPNLFVNVELAVDLIHNALVVPESAVIPTLGGNFVFVIENGIALRREVKITDRAPGKAVVRDGLAKGAQVVTAGHQKIKDQMPVMPLPPGGMAALMKGPPGAPPAADAAKPMGTPPAPPAPPKVNEVVTPPVTAPPEPVSAAKDQK